MALCGRHAVNRGKELLFSEHAQSPPGGAGTSNPQLLRDRPPGPGAAQAGNLLENSVRAMTLERNRRDRGGTARLRPSNKQAACTET
jgi:hypothetical protein